MHVRTTRFLPVFASFLLGSPSLLTAKGPELPSTWRVADVVVDGQSSDWSGRLLPLAGTPLVMGVRNDASFVYVCVRTSDAEAKKQILTLGLSVYLDASGKESRGFGVQFPVGRFGAGRDHADVPEPGDDHVSRKLDLALAGNRIQILGESEADLAMLRVSEASPIEAALGDEDGALVVELKVPLVFSVETPHAVDSRPGKTISVGLATAQPKVKRSKTERPEGVGYGPAGPPGGGGGMRGGGHRGGGGMSKGEKDIARSLGKPLEAWVSVPLATEPKT